jgi:hypothetical protein
MHFDGATASIETAFDDPVAAGAEVVATVARPGGGSVKVPLRRMDDRTFVGDTEVGAAGTYGIGVTAAAGGEVQSAISATAELGFSREYLLDRSDPTLLTELSTQTGGRGVISATDAFDSEGLTAGRRFLDWRHWALAFALLLIPIAVALSRLRFRAGPLAAERLARPESFGDLSSRLGQRRRSARGTGPQRGEEPSSSGTGAASSSPTVADIPSPTVPTEPTARPSSPARRPASHTTGEPSSIDSLLEAKRRRREGG